MTYKLLINAYLSTLRKTSKDAEKPSAAETQGTAVPAASSVAGAPAHAAAPAADPDGIPDEEDGPADG
jgi:hypothetical protein